MKTAISIPDPLFQEAEHLAHLLGFSRSELYAKAVACFIAEQNKNRVTERLNAIYSEESNSLDDDLYALQMASIEPETWP